MTDKRLETIVPRRSSPQNIYNLLHSIYTISIGRHIISSDKSLIIKNPILLWGLRVSAEIFLRYTHKRYPQISLPQFPSSPQSSPQKIYNICYTIYMSFRPQIHNISEYTPTIKNPILLRGLRGLRGSF
jgi:hypothetical protein